MRFAALLFLAAALAGCGGSESARLDHVGYEVRLAPLDDAVNAALEEHAGAATQLRDLAETLEGVVPPANAEAENRELVTVLRYLAQDVEEDDFHALSVDLDRLQDVVYALGEVGYLAFDGPDDR